MYESSAIKESSKSDHAPSFLVVHFFTHKYDFLRSALSYNESSLKTYGIRALPYHQKERCSTGRIYYHLTFTDSELALACDIASVMGLA